MNDDNFKTQVRVFIPDTILREVRTYRQENNLSLSAVVEAAMEQYLASAIRAEKNETDYNTR